MDSLSSSGSSDYYSDDNGNSLKTQPTNRQDQTTLEVATYVITYTIMLKSNVINACSFIASNESVLSLLNMYRACKLHLDFWYLKIKMKTPKKVAPQDTSI